MIVHVESTEISGVKVVQRSRQGDARGFLTRLYCRDSLRAAGWIRPVVQINHTLTSVAGTVRGMHFQHPPYSEMKLVNCVAGEAWDVVVDLREGSPTFLQWHAELISEQNGRSVLVPEGCAHGFQALVDNCAMIYCHSAAYASGAEGGVRHDDPALNIKWPLPPQNLSPRDLSHSFISEDFIGIKIE